MTENTTLYAGFGRAVITPAHNEDGTLIQPIELYTAYFATSVFNDILATTIALHDGNTTILLLTLDLRDIRPAVYDRIAARLVEETGIPKENILVSTVHNHSAPELSILINMQDQAALDAYEDFIVETIPLSAKAALADLAPATMKIGKSKTDRINFVRRYIMSDGSLGSIRVVNAPGTYAVAHESEADPELQTLRLVRDGKKDIIMTNWQCHPAALSPKETINADWVHYWRCGIEEKHDAYFAFFQGAQGNVNQISRVAGEQKLTMTGVDRLIAMGDDLIAVTEDAMKNMEELPASPIKVSYVKMPHEIEKYNEKINLFVTAIGDFALTAQPFEMFHQYGEYTKAHSPAKMTFFVGLSNGYHSYLPTEEVIARGYKDGKLFDRNASGYELACCRFAEDKEIGNKIVQHFLDTLNSFKNEG